jgi:hypothetical protein
MFANAENESAFLLRDAPVIKKCFSHEVGYPSSAWDGLR